MNILFAILCCILAFIGGCRFGWRWHINYRQSILSQRDFYAVSGRYAETTQCYLDALQEIHRTQGKVCEHFETCKHIGCQSSYASWAIADKALYPEKHWPS